MVLVLLVGFCKAELNPVAVHSYEVPVPVAVKLSGCPAHRGPLFAAVTVGRGFIVTTIAARGLSHVVVCDT